MVYRKQLSIDEIMDILDKKSLASKRTGYALPVRVYEVSDNNSVLKFLLPDNVKTIINIDHVRLNSFSKNNQTLIFTKKSFFYTLLRFTQPHSRPVRDIDGFIQMIPGSYKSDEPINITGNDKVHLKADCIHESVVNGIRELVFYSFALDKRPGHNIFKEPRIKLSKKIKEVCSVSYIIFYLEDDDHKPVDFNGGTIGFSCQFHVQN